MTRDRYTTRDTVLDPYVTTYPVSSISTVMSSFGSVVYLQRWLVGCYSGIRVVRREDLPLMNLMKEKE